MSRDWSYVFRVVSYYNFDTHMMSHYVIWPHCFGREKQAKNIVAASSVKCLIRMNMIELAKILVKWQIQLYQVKKISFGHFWGYLFFFIFLLRRMSYTTKKSEIQQEFNFWQFPWGLTLELIAFLLQDWRSKFQRIDNIYSCFCFQPNKICLHQFSKKKISTKQWTLNI